MRATGWAWLGLVALLAGCTTSPAPYPTSSSGSTAFSAASQAASSLRVEQVTGGLEHPWDLAFLPDGKVLVTERAGRLVLLASTRPGAQRTPVSADTGEVNARGEGGLMGLLVAPDFATSREFLTCETHSTTDIRVVVRRLSADGRSAARTRDLVTGLPVAAGGRHSGCRMTYGPDGMLYIGTGDTADPAVPQDRTSLGGKVLRVDPRTGAAPPDNPFAASADPRERLVWTYGHRNVQGLAVRAGKLYSAEHGPDRNDEVNLLRGGANYGWDPSRGGRESSYDESVPMTDLTRFPDAVTAIWESGDTTEAVCALTTLTGSAWKGWEGALVLTALKGAKLLVLQLDSSGSKVTSRTIPTEIADRYGRLRAARQGPDGALYLSTSNGEDDKILRVTPS